MILTPPEIASAEDDGYLTATEIAMLKLNADWVVLSACNTAAGSADDDEPLSGIAQAFFYAKTRALLISHWSVNSRAAVDLVTGAFKKIADKKANTRAKALQSAMIDMISGTNEDGAHPQMWSPFSFAGDPHVDLLKN